MQYDESTRTGCDYRGRAGFLGTDAYGSLFSGPALPPWLPIGPGDPRDAIFALSEELYGESEPNPAVPAGYSFFGQFITHDLTFTATGTQLRTPRFDLDCVYGGGPDVHPFLYELRDPRRLLVGHNEFGELDLPRNVDISLDQGTTGTFDRRRSALIGDPRNDENTVVSQLHLAILRLHNRLVEDRGFEAARRIVRWSYQKAVLDFLRRVCGREVVEAVLQAGDEGLAFFRIDANRVFVPNEFSFAAFRMGHSMIGETYHLSDVLEGERLGTPFLLFADGPPDWAERNKRAQNTLEGQRELPRRWTIQWDRFVGESSWTQASRRIDRRLAEPLRHLPVDVPPGASDERVRSIAYRTLLAGWRQNLPSGQAIADAMGVGKLPSEKGVEDPLWVYVLREAEENQGRELGPVGARIIAEVCVGLLAADRDSFLQGDRKWEPWNDLGLARGGEFGLADLLRAAGVPVTREEWEAAWAQAQGR